jgi:hypothetical protein
MPARLVIESGERLGGEVAVSGALPSLLTAEPLVLENIRRLA